MIMDICPLENSNNCYIKYVILSVSHTHGLQSPDRCPPQKVLFFQFLPFITLLKPLLPNLFLLSTVLITIGRVIILGLVLFLVKSVNWEGSVDGPGS